MKNSLKILFSIFLIHKIEITLEGEVGIDDDILEKIESSGYQICDINDKFYQDFCNNVFIIADINQEDKVKHFYSNDTMCSTKISGNIPVYPKGLNKMLNFDVFNCFSFSMNIGFLISFIILIALIVLSFIFCCCEIHYTKSLIYKTLPSNPPKEGDKKEGDKKEGDKKEGEKKGGEKKEGEKKEGEKKEGEKKQEENKNEENKNNENKNEEKKEEEENKENENNENLEEKEENDNINEEIKIEEIKEKHYKEKDFEKYNPPEKADYGKFKFFFLRKFAQEMEFVRIIYFHEKHMSYSLDISYFLISILFNLFITCLLYGDTSVHKQFELQKKLDFMTIILNGIIGVFVSNIIMFFFHKLVIYNPTLLNILEESPNHKIKGLQQLNDFMCYFYAKVIIYFIIQYGIVIICFIYITAFFKRYQKLSVNALISFIIGGLLIAVLYLLFALGYAILRIVSYSREKKKNDKRNEILKVEDSVHEIEEEEEEENEEAEEEEKKFDSIDNKTNRELETKGNLPQKKKSRSE